MRDAVKDEEGSIKILCIGESTTESGGWNESSSWPKQLEVLLQERLTKPVTVFNRGIVGTNSIDILKQLPLWLEEMRPHIVISMIGINDDLNVLVYQTENQSKFEQILNYSRFYRFIRMLVRSKTANDTTFSVAEQSSRIPEELLIRKNRAFESNNLSEQLAVYEELATLDPSTPVYYYGFIKDILFGFTSPEAMKSAAKKLSLPTDSLDHKWDLQKIYDKANELNLDVLSLFKLKITLLTQLERHDELYSFLDSCLQNSQTKLYALIRLALDEDSEKSVGEPNLDNWEKINDLVRTRPVIRRSIALYLLQEGDFKRANLFLEKEDENQFADYESRAVHIRNKALALWMSNQKEAARLLFNTDTENQIRKPNLTTKRHYPLIIQTIKKFGAVSVAMQYSMMSLSSLRALLVGAEPDLYIDNEKLFQDAILDRGYRELFNDVFAGSFGHTTTEGNKILAQHISDELLRVLLLQN